MRALAILVVAACGTPAAPATPSNKVERPPAAHEVMATIERTACYGWCPIYKLTVYRDGVVEYSGDKFVKTTGKATGHLDPTTLAALDALFQENGYLGLRDAYEEYMMTDMPSVFTSYAPPDGKPKTIKHYLGDSSAPESLGKIEDGIDRIVKIEQWIGTREEREKLSGR